MNHAFLLGLFVFAGLTLPSYSYAKKLKAPAPVSIQVLTPKDLAALKKEKCVYFHVWATWCSICMEEMPDLIKLLKSQTMVKPVVIDVSPISVQESFSKKWMQSLRPGFTTYVKPDMKDQPFMDALEKSWSGTLPFSALFHKGKLLKTWVGSSELKNLPIQFKEYCDAR